MDFSSWLLNGKVDKLLSLLLLFQISNERDTYDVTSLTNQLVTEIKPCKWKEGMSLLQSSTILFQAFIVSETAHMTSH